MGKGTNDRWRCHVRNVRNNYQREISNNPELYRKISDILDTGKEPLFVFYPTTTEQEALTLEVAKIKQYGRNVLLNKTIGGDGVCGILRPDQSKKIQIINAIDNPARRPGVREKISLATRGQNNPMYGKGYKNSGERSGKALLTRQEVYEIRHRYIPRKYTQQQLADDYGVTLRCIGKILRYETWRDQCQRSL